jgi:hypothetical protein
MTVRDADGRPRNVAFPTKLATANETNRGLANQEVARRALEQRLDRLEARGAAQLKNGSSVSGIVTLLIGGGLTAFSIFKASQAAGSSGSVFSKWAEQDTAKMATLSSVSQITATGAKLRQRPIPPQWCGHTDASRRPRSGFALASLHQPVRTPQSSKRKTMPSASQPLKITPMPSRAISSIRPSRAPRACTCCARPSEAR